MNAAAHGQNVYTTRASTGLSWHQPHLDTSLKLIQRAEGRAVLDAGGGDATLIDDLLAEGYGPLTCTIWPRPRSNGAAASGPVG